MAEPSQDKISREVLMPQDEKGTRVEKPGARYCAICGADANVYGLAVERFGEAFCSDGHAEEFAKEVRAARVQAAATALAASPATREAERAEGQAPAAPKQRGWTHYLKMGACCAAPLLALVVLAGGGGALLGAAGTVLPLLLVLACPLGMYFLMRGMNKMEHKQHGDDKREPK